MKIGDRVEILRSDIFHLKHRKHPWFGRIESIDGGLLLVRPMWCKWNIELFREEVKQ